MLSKKIMKNNRWKGDNNKNEQNQLKTWFSQKNENIFGELFSDDQANLYLFRIYI